MQLSEQEIVRREKLSKLRELGIDPYPADLFEVNITAKRVKQEFEQLQGKPELALAGRLMTSGVL